MDGRHLSPVSGSMQLIGLKKPLDVQLDFEAHAVDEILQRLNE
jgi:hypothetical protein